VLDPAFWDDTDVCSLSRDARLLLAAMITLLADDHGRLPADPGYLKRKVFGEDEDLGRSEVKVLRDAILEKCRNAKLYEVNGQEYIWLTKFEGWQKIRWKVNSRIPAYPEPEVLHSHTSNSKPVTSEVLRSSPKSAENCGSRVARAVGLGSMGFEVEVEPPIAPPERGGVSRVSRQRHAKRNYDQISRALGSERTKWWIEFWRLYPCHQGKQPAMDAFERVVRSPETWAQVRAGLDRYTAKVRDDPNLRVKYAQGWLNDARWDDEPDPAPPPSGSRGRRKQVLEEAKQDFLQEEENAETFRSDDVSREAFSHGEFPAGQRKRQGNRAHIGGGGPGTKLGRPHRREAA
jgi:hypothetical protein